LAHTATICSGRTDGEIPACIGENEMG